jgi:hypothetical protein
MSSLLTVLTMVHVVLFASIVNVSAKASLGQGLRGSSREQVEASLMTELQGTFRPSATLDHIMNLEAKLKTLCVAVPQHSDGTLSHTVVRYVLHRFFAKRGWFVRGLEPSDTSHNITKGDHRELGDLKEWAPTILQQFLEQLAGGRGASLREVAVLAASIEDLIHKEATSRLEQAFQYLELPSSTRLDEDAVKEVLEVYMMIYHKGGRFYYEPGREGVAHARKFYNEKVRDWRERQAWMDTVRGQLYPSGTLDFNATTLLVEAIGERYGDYNEKECALLKSELLEVESKKAGRVQLPDFYKKGLSGVFSFTEKIDYLRDIGAADETEANDPYVVIPNYVSARPNCLRTSDFYVVCCRNECEDLMAKLEAEFANETAAPEAILKLVASLSSDTIEAPRKLSTSLTRRLRSIAKSNDGLVPLHGRLFSQWMHHAFPRECPYPAAPGAANPQTPDEWMKETGHTNSKLTEDELAAHNSTEDSPEKVKGAEARKHHHFAENELPWTEAEKLLVPVPSEQTQRRGPWQVFIVFVMLSLGVTVLMWFARKKLAAAQARLSKGNLKPCTSSGDGFKLA